MPYRLSEAKQRHPGLDQVVNQCPAMPQEVVDLLRVTDNGTDIVYHLGKNPQIARDIAAAYAAGDRQTVANALDYVSNGLRFSQQHAQQPQRPQTMNLEPLLPTSAPLPDVRKV